MNLTQQRSIALSAALGLGAVALLVVLVLGAAGALDIGTVIALLVAVVVYGVLVLGRLRHRPGDPRA